MLCSKNQTCRPGSYDNVRTRKQFVNPKLMSSSTYMDNLIRGMVNQELGLRDISFEDDVRNHLFEGLEGDGGLDLVALSIQVSNIKPTEKLKG